MKAIKKYKNLDEIGFIGIQESKTITESKYHAHKTAEIFRQARQNKSELIKAVTINKAS